MGSRLSRSIPARTPRQRPFSPYYAAVDTWWERGDRHRDSILLAGSPRSGTTWLAQIVAGLTGLPLLDEPTRVVGLPEMREQHGWDGRPSREPEDADPDLAVDLERILTGTYLGPGVIARSWPIERALWTRRPMVAKVVDLNLLLPWIAVHLPRLTILHLVRHPLEAVASQVGRGESVWARQQTLPVSYQRFLGRHPEYAAPVEYDSVAECMVTEWAIEHAWLRDRAAELERVTTVRYEDLRADFAPSVTRLCKLLRVPEPDPGTLDRLRGASRSTGAQTTIGKRSDSGWRSRFTPEQVDRLRAILDRYDNPFYGPDQLGDPADPA